MPQGILGCCHRGGGWCCARRIRAEWVGYPSPRSEVPNKLFAPFRNPFATKVFQTESGDDLMPARPTVATAFQRLISSEDHRQMLRNRLGLEVDEQLPASLAALLQELERREQVEADWSASTMADAGCPMAFNESEGTFSDRHGNAP